MTRFNNGGNSRTVLAGFSSSSLLSFQNQSVRGIEPKADDRRLDAGRGGREEEWKMHPFTKVRKFWRGSETSVSSPNSAIVPPQVQQAMLEEEKWTTPSMTYFR